MCASIHTGEETRDGPLRALALSPPALGWSLSLLALPGPHPAPLCSLKVTDAERSLWCQRRGRVRWYHCQAPAPRFRSAAGGSKAGVRLGLHSEDGHGGGAIGGQGTSLRAGPPTPPHTRHGGTHCLLKVTVSVLAEGLEDHGADGHERLHHAELQGGLLQREGQESRISTETTEAAAPLASWAWAGCQGMGAAQPLAPGGTAVRRGRQNTRYSNRAMQLREKTGWGEGRMAETQETEIPPEEGPP